MTNYRNISTLRLCRAFFCAALLAMFALPAAAFDYASTDSQTEHSAQLRTGFDFSTKFSNGLRLSATEDLRFDLYNSLTGTNFSKSYTTLNLAYAPIKYVKFDAGYTLKLLGTKDWSDPNEWLRHRIFFSLTGSYKWQQLKLSVRERAMLEMRTDSINPLEKNRYNWLLRSKISAEYTSRRYPIKPYAWVELVNTLNAPEYEMWYKNNDTSNKGHQYLSRVRTAVGVKYQLNSQNTLNFFYRFNYGYDRDVNITKRKQLIELTEIRAFQHALGVVYEFNLKK